MAGLLRQGTRAFDDEEIRDAQWHETIMAKTHRQHLNLAYAHKAFKILMRGKRVPPEFHWLYEWKRTEQTSRYCKTTILSELGRFLKVDLIAVLPVVAGEPTSIAEYPTPSISGVVFLLSRDLNQSAS